MLLVNTYQKSTNSFLNSFVKRILFILLCGTYFCVAGCGGNDKETPETTSESVTAEEVTSIEKVSTDDIAKELQANKGIRMRSLTIQLKCNIFVFVRQKLFVS